MNYSEHEVAELAYSRGYSHANYRYAYVSEIAAESPLSGEWSGDPTAASVAAELGITADDGDVYDIVADEWQRGYSEYYEEQDSASDVEHEGHYSAFGNQFWCDTCNSPYCNLA